MDTQDKNLNRNRDNQDHNTGEQKSSSSTETQERATDRSGDKEWESEGAE